MLNRCTVEVWGWISNFIMAWNYLSTPNFNGCTVEVWEWISNFTGHFTGLDKPFGAYTPGFIDKQSFSLWESLAYRPESLNLSGGSSYNWTCVPWTGFSRYKPDVHFTGPDLFSANWPWLYQYDWWRHSLNCLVTVLSNTKQLHGEPEYQNLTLLTHFASAAYTDIYVSELGQH